MKNYTEKLMDKLENEEFGLEVFGWAAHAYDAINRDKPDFEKFIKFVLYCGELSITYKYPKGTLEAMTRFCHLCLVDPMLVEAYLGMRLKQVASNLEQMYADLKARVRG